MALVTAPIIWLAPGVTIYATADSVTELVSAVTADNLTDRPVTVIYMVAGRVRQAVVPPGSVGVSVPQSGRAPRAGESIQISGVF